MSKREIATDKSNTTLSDNISLFQSLRVLQDEDEEANIKEEAAISSEYLKCNATYMYHILMISHPPHRARGTK